MINIIKKYILSSRIKRAAELAKTLTDADRKKRLVLLVAGVPKVYTKQELKRLLLTKHFKKGTTIQDLERVAIIIIG